MPDIAELDLVAQVEELLANPTKRVGRTGYAYELLRRLVEEVKTLRAHVADLNHDFDAANKHCEEYHYERTTE